MFWPRAKDGVLKPILLLALALSMVGAVEAEVVAEEQIVVKWDDVRQVIDGFGACDGWFEDEWLAHENKDEMFDLLFSQDRGIGLSILRHRVPSRPGEYVDYGMELDGNDLDMGDKAWVGLSYRNLPKALPYRSVKVQFTCHQVSPHSGTLSFYTEIQPRGPFADRAGDLEGRQKSKSSVLWKPPAWNKAKASDDQHLSPELLPIVDEAFSANGGGVDPVSTLNILIRGKGGKRSAVSYDRKPEQAAKLVIVDAQGLEHVIRLENSESDAEMTGMSQMKMQAIISQEAVKRGVDKVWASAWSPPARFKNNHKVNNGFLKLEHHRAYAEHLERYRRLHLEYSGIPLYGLSPQNEPGRKPWESCEWKNTHYRDFIRDHLGPVLDPSCQLIACEETRWGSVPKFYGPSFEDPKAHGFVDILAGHCYPKSDIDVSHAKFGRRVWMTEWSYDTSKEDLSISNGVRWAHNFWRLLVNAEVNALHHWWLVNFKGEGKQQGLLNAQVGVSGIEVPKRMWTIGNFSKFVRPGWKRLEVTRHPVAQVSVAAFIEPKKDHPQLALVVIHQGKKDVRVQCGDLGFSKDQRFVPHRSSETEDLKELEAVTIKESWLLPAQSVTTYVTRL